MDKTRNCALNILYRVLQQDAYATLLMRKIEDDIDSRFLTTLVFTTLRNVYLLDYQYENLVTKRIKPKTKTLLRMGVAQLFLLADVPEYAAIDTTVDLAQKHEKAFINAILHACAKQGFRQPLSLDIATSHPLWLVKMWQKQYGEEITEKILKANGKASRVYGRLNTLKATKEELVDLGFTFVNDVTFTGDRLLEREAFQSGKYVIQDIHATDVVKHLDVQKGMRVLDACASPGTKTQLIAMRMENEGSVYAFDLHPHRIELIKNLMEKTGVTIVNTQVRDSSVYDPALPEFDRILLDVPCSGLGDLRHKPEIRYHIQPRDLDEIVDVQRKILDVNSRYLALGGILLYSTCTLNKKENEKMIASFLQTHPQYRLSEEKTYFPYEEDGDGFYYAKLQRMI